MDQKSITEEAMNIKDKIVKASFDERRDIPTENMNQFLVFKINDDEYALDVLSVQEIVRYTYLTPVPGSPSYMKGLINLRGNILNVIDLSERVGAPRNNVETESNVIIVVSLDSRKFGIMVDMVSDVVDVYESSITENPMVDNESNFIQASHIVKVDDRIIIVLPIVNIIGYK